MKKIVLFLFAASLAFFSKAQNADLASASKLVAAHAAEIGLTKSDLANYLISSTYKSEGTQLVYLNQSLKGIPVYNQMLVLAFKNDQLVSNAGNFIPEIEKNALSAQPSLNVAAAIGAAFKNAGLNAPSVAPSAARDKNNRMNFGILRGVNEDVTAELIWVPTTTKASVSLKLAWQIQVVPDKGADWFLMQIDAQNGSLINRINLTVFEHGKEDKGGLSPYLSRAAENTLTQGNPFSAKTNTAQSPASPAVVGTVNYLVIPYPAESPVHPGGTAAVRTNPWTAAPGAASALGWHNDGAIDYTITRGNNTWATEDRAATNGNTITTPSGLPATSTTSPDPLNFNFPPTYNTDPVRTNNQRFAITNLFYWNNIMHDVMYQYGFTETAGNFQANNQSLGGSQNDYVIAIAQSNVSTDNANFATPSDGGRPRMRMYLFAPVTNPFIVENSPSSANYACVESNFGDAVNFIPAKNKLGDTGPITGQVVYFDDATGGTHEACTGAPATSITGKIALINRGTCNFTVKVHAAQDAGAIGVIVVNNVPDAPIIMGGGPDFTITVPAVMISQADGATLASKLASNLNVTLNGAPRLDGDLDAGVMCHEFTHGISNRLTGGPSASTCLQNAEQGGEGWSDYAALMMTTNWATATVSDGPNARPVGTYVGTGTTAGGGIRNFPYSTNMTINPLTYANVGIAPIGTEVHNIGEVWCTAAWEMTWAIIQQENAINPNLYSYNVTANGGNSIALKLVLEGMKLQPCGPGFIDARNAILAADRNLYAGRHACAIWTAFAKRGMGYGALQGSASSATDQTAATNMPPAPAITTQPGNTSVAAAANATFTVVSDLTTNVIYNWQVSTDNGVTWSNVSPAVITPTLTLNNVTCAMTGYKYRSQVFIGCAITTSDPATLTVTGCSTAPTITTQPANTTACAGANATFTVAATGTGLTYSWEVSTNGGTSWTPVTPAATTATLTLTGVTIAMNNNQYHVIVTSGATSTTSTAAILTVTAVPAAPAVTTPVTYCQNATATALTATGTGLLWYTAATGGTGVATAPTPSTAIVGSITYYVSQTTGTCESPRAAIVVNVTATPAAPAVTSPVTYCQNAVAVPLTATGANLKWYTVATGGTPLAGAPTPVTTTAGTTIYYVSQTTGTCEGPRAAITVIVNATPPAPTVTTPVTFCQNTTATALTATGTGLLWYAAATGGAGSATAPTPSTTTVGSTTYYVSQTTACGESPRAAIVVNITAPPAAPAVATPVAYCQNATATALSATGTGLLWYAAATGGTGSATAPTPSTVTVGSTTYYVSQTLGCESPRAAIVVNVTATPAAPAVTTPVTYCQNAVAVPLTATGTSLKWYTVATGGTALAGAPTPVTTTAGTTTYYVSQTTGTCEGPRAAIVVNVTAATTAPTVTTPVIYCQGATATALTATGTGLLWYAAATGGAGSATAPVPSTATAGSITYYVSQTTACGEGPRAAIVVTVNALPAAPTVSSPVALCQGSTAAALTATGTGLLWYTTATGGTGSATAIVPSTTTVGSTTYYVSQTTGTCEGPRAAIVVNVTPTPAAPVVTTPVTYCQGATAVALTATGTNLKWYTTATGGTALAGAPTPVTTTVGSTIYYVSQTTGTCEGPRAAITVNITSAPVITTQPADITSCTTTATFTVVATGSSINYQWQLSTDGGTTYNNIAGATSATLVVNNLTPAQAAYKYRVVLTSGSCGAVTSIAVTARVGNPPVVVLTSSGGTQINPAHPTTLSTTVSPVNPSYTYQWRRNGTLLSNSGATITNLTGLQDEFGAYQVTVTDPATGCSGVSNIITLSDIPSERDRLFVSPNPTRNTVRVSYYSSTTTVRATMISVYDSKGAIVQNGRFNVSGNYGSMTIDLSKYPNGVYMIELRDAAGKKLKSEQVIKF
jgi:hypothetical protein